METERWDRIGVREGGRERKWREMRKENGGEEGRSQVNSREGSFLPSDPTEARELGFRARRLLWRLPAMELPTSLPVRLGLSRTKHEIFSKLNQFPLSEVRKLNTCFYFS